MSKLKRHEEIPVLIINETVDNFFARGRETARLLDQNKPISLRRVISFEDIQDLVKFLQKTTV